MTASIYCCEYVLNICLLLDEHVIYAWKISLKINWVRPLKTRGVMGEELRQ